MANLVDTPSIGEKDINLVDLRVLVTDQHELMRNLFVNIFHSLGCFNIRAARHGEEAIDRLHGFGPDLLLTDWLMSPIDGIELTKYVRTNGASPDKFLPIMMVTALTAQKNIVTARDAGVTEVVAKPVSARSLHCKLRHMVLHPRPFVRTASFFGPDRRRREMRHFTGVERRGNGVRKAASGLRASVATPGDRQSDGAEIGGVAAMGRG